VDSPEARGLAVPPWLFSRQGLIVVGLVAAVAATFSAVDVAFLAGCLLVIGLLGRVWAAVSLKRVGFRRGTNRARAFSGDDLQLEAVLSNPRLLPLPWVEVWELVPDALQPDEPRERSFAQPGFVWVQRGMSLWPYQRVRWRRRLHCRARGVYQLGNIVLRTGDPFGFFERERTLSDHVEVLVYPRVVPLRRIDLPLRHPSMDVVSPRSPIVDPTRTATVRDYRPDDARRLIHWPTSARRGALQVRVLEPATSLHVSLVLDVRGFTFGVYRGELLDLVLSALASLAVHMQEAGFPVALYINSDPPVSLAPGASVGHLQHVLEAMARLDPVGGPPLLPWALEVVPRRSTVVVGFSEMSSDLERTLGQLEAAHLSVLPLLAVSNAPKSTVRSRVLYITPGTDVGATLESHS
jgi:uncharacterized protein (DUF58 family)